MSMVFKGRAVIPGTIDGEALVTQKGFNTLACFYQSILQPCDQAICSDQDNKELYLKNLTGKIICLPVTVGSTTAGAVWERIARLGIAPKAMLFSGHIDCLAAAGLFIAYMWCGKSIYTVDCLGDNFLSLVREGQYISISEDGTVTVQ